MYRVCSLILTSLILTSDAWFQKKDNKEENVIRLKKMENVKKLSPHVFHDLNAGHIVYNYFEVVTGEVVHLDNFHNLQYTGKIYVGSPKQKLNVVFDIAEGDVLVLSSSFCNYFGSSVFNGFCNKHNSYNMEKSTTKTMDSGILPMFSLADFGSMEIRGHLSYDNVKVANWTALATTIGVIEEWKNSFQFSKVDGIVGLGKKELAYFHYKSNLYSIATEEANKIIERSTLIERLQEKGVSKVGFHLYKDKKGHEVGELIVGAEKDDHRRKGKLEWMGQQQKLPRNSHWQSFWSFDLRNIGVLSMGNGKLNVIKNEQLFVIPDPGTSLIVGPPSIIEEINKAIFKGLKNVQRQPMDRSMQFDCKYADQLPIVTFQIVDRVYMLEPKDYVKRFPKKICTTGFMAMLRLKVLIIGDVFFRKYYTVFDFTKERIGLAESIPPF